MAFIFPYIGSVIIPTDELHHFSGGGSTTNQWCPLGDIFYGRLNQVTMGFNTKMI